MQLLHGLDTGFFFKDWEQGVNGVILLFYWKTAQKKCHPATNKINLISHIRSASSETILRAKDDLNSQEWPSRIAQGLKVLVSTLCIRTEDSIQHPERNTITQMNLYILLFPILVLKLKVLRYFVVWEERDKMIME